MGISINVGGNRDYSSLFQSLSSNGGMGNMSFLSDYASIKNGSYGKLMKSYYGTRPDAAKAISGKKDNASNVLDKILEEKKIRKFQKMYKRQMQI